MRTFNLYQKDSFCVDVNAYLGIVWLPDNLHVKDHFIIIINGDNTRSINFDVKYSPGDSKISYVETSAQQQIINITKKGNTKFVDAITNLQVNKNWTNIGADKGKLKAVQTYEITFYYNTKYLEDLGYAHKVITVSKLEVTLGWMAFNLNNTTYYHITDAEFNKFTLDTTDIFDYNLSCKYKSLLSGTDEKKYMYLYCNDNEPIYVEINHNNDSIKLPLETKYPEGVLTIDENNSEWNGIRSAKDSKITLKLDTSKNTLCFDGYSWKSEFTIKYNSREYIPNFQKNGLSELNWLIITNLILNKLECNNGSVLESSIEAKDSNNKLNNYLLRANTAKGVVGKSLTINLYVNNNKLISWEHYDKKVKHKKSWTWTHEVNGSQVDEKIPVYYYKYRKDNNTAEFWYDIVLNEDEKKLTLYKVILKFLERTPETNKSEITYFTPETTKKPDNDKTEDTSKVNATAGKVDNAGTSPKSSKKETTVETPKDVSSGVVGGREEDVQKRVNELKEEGEEIERQKQEVKDKVQAKKDNKKLKEVLAKTKEALVLSKKAFDTVNAFKDNLTAGISQATSLAVVVTETILLKLQDNALEEKLNTFKEFMNEVKERYQGKFNILYTKTKENIQGILTDVRTGEDDVLSRMNNLLENCITETRKLFKAFVKEIEDEANRVVEVINNDFMSKASAKVQKELAQATKKVRDSAETTLTKAVSLGKAQAAQLMSKLKALSGQ